MVHINTTTFSFPMVSGLHCAGGVVYPLKMSGDAGASGAAKSLHEFPEARTSVQLMPSFEAPTADGRHVLIGGGGGWEGEGFLALVDATTREAQWVLYVQDSEEFVAASEISGAFSAVSECYPYRFEWRVHGGDLPLVEYSRAIAA